MTALYELTSQMIGLHKLIEDGEMEPQALQDTLDGLEGDIQVKAEGLLAYVANMGADLDAIDAAVKRLTERRTAITNRQESLREYLRFNMEASGIDKITCPLFTITLRKAPDVVVIESEDLIPAMYKETVETVKISKEAIKRHLKSGEHVPGARLGEGKRGLIIK
jgi:hypothetical protein